LRGPVSVGSFGPVSESRGTEVLMEPQPHGGALLRSAGPGRPRSQAGIAIQESRYELMRSLKRLVAIRDQGMCEKCGRGSSSAEEIVKACLGILRFSGIEREKPRSNKRSTFSVVSASLAEQAAKVRDATTPTTAKPESG
jgi:hypothetical protein